MTVASETNKSGPYNGNDSTTVFAYSFRVLNEAHLTVIKTVTATGVETVQTLTTHYTVASVGSATGSITMLTAPATGTTITIIRDAPFKQEVDFENQGAFFAEVVEEAFDLLTMQTQQLKEEVDRSVKVAASSSTDPATLIASLEASEVAATASAAAAAADVVLTHADVVLTHADVVLTAADVVTAAASASGAQTAETNAETAETNAELAETHAETAETNAAASAAAAAASALAASGSASTATTKAGEASTSATNAQTAETNAELAEVNAETAETNAAASAVAAAASAAAAAAGKVSTRTLLKALDTTSVTVAYLTESGREGRFVWRTGDYAARVTADPGEGVFIKADAIATTAGAWVRVEATKEVRPKWCGALADGSTNDYTAIDRAFDLAVLLAVPLGFTAGTYSYGTTLDFTSEGIRIRAEGAVVLQFTGTGKCVIFDAGAGSTNYYDMSFEGFIIEGNASATDGLYTRGVHHSRFQCEVRDVDNAGLKVEFGVMNKYDIAVTSNRQAFTTVPLYGVYFGIRGAGEYVADCQLHAIVEGITGTGIQLQAARGCTISGTSEGNTGTGVSDSTSSGDCTFNDFWMEANTARDMELYGYGHKFRNCRSQSAGSGNTIELVTAKRTVFDGCNLRVVNHQSTSADTLYLGGSVSDNVSLGLIGTGTRVNWNLAKVDTSGVKTGMVTNAF